MERDGRERNDMHVGEVEDFLRLHSPHQSRKGIGCRLFFCCIPWPI